MKPDIKAVIENVPKGTQFTVYERFWFFWLRDYGYKPLRDTTLFLIEQDLERLKRVYGERLIIEDRRVVK